MPLTTPLPPGPGPAAGGIFISYRRGIDNDSAGRLFDRLAIAFPESRIFRDVDSALDLLGLDFHQVLTDRVQGCAVLVAVIGRGWIDSIPRLEAEADFVRIELAAALARPDLRLIPVLVGDVDMPKAEALPEVLRPLVRRGAIRLTNEGYSKAVETVIRAIAQVIAQGAKTGPARAPVPLAMTSAAMTSAAVAEAEAGADAAPPSLVRPSVMTRAPGAVGPVHLWMRRFALAGVAGAVLTWLAAHAVILQAGKELEAAAAGLSLPEPHLLRPDSGAAGP